MPDESRPRIPDSAHAAKRVGGGKCLPSRLTRLPCCCTHKEWQQIGRRVSCPCLKGLGVFHACRRGIALMSPRIALSRTSCASCGAAGIPPLPGGDKARKSFSAPPHRRELLLCCSGALPMPKSPQQTKSRIDGNRQRSLLPSPCRRAYGLYDRCVQPCGNHCFILKCAPCEFSFHQSVVVLRSLPFPSPH